MSPAFTTTTALLMRIPSLTLLVLVGAATHAAAQNVPRDSARTLPDLIVTSTRTASQASGAAGSVTVVDAATLTARQSPTADDALRGLAGVSVVGDGRYGEEVRINLRGLNSGFSTQRTLVLMDGRPLTDEYLGHADLGQYPLDAIERIEVGRGALSAAWGSNALGGVVNLRARRGSPTPRTTLTAEGGSFGTWRGALSHGRQWGRVDAFASAGASTTDGYRRTSAGQAVDWDGRNALLNVGYQGARVSLRSLSTGFIGKGTDELFDRDITRLAEDLSLRLAHGRAAATTEVRGYLTHLDQDLAWHGAPTVGYRQTGVGGYVAHTRVIGQRHQVLAGADLRRNAARVSEFAGVVDRNETIAAAFLQDEITLGRAGLLLGVRADRGGTGDRALTYRAGAHYDLDARTRLRGGIARAVRAPTLSDRYLPPTPFGPVIFVGNPDLEPETAVSVEAGVVRQFGRGTTLEITGYYIRSDGFWDFLADTGAVFRAANITEVPVYGVEVSGRATLRPGLVAEGSYTFTDASYERFTGNPAVEGNYVDDNVKHAASLTLTWTPSGGSTLWVSGFRSGHRYTDPENTSAGLLPGYTLLSAGASVQVGGGLDLRVRADNLLDRRYRTRPEYRQAGRAVFAGLRLSR